MVKSTKLYDLLGVDPKATQKEIVKAYRVRARILHPDKCENKEEANTNFQTLQSAFEILRDEDKRKNYDNYGDAGLEMSSDFEAAYEYYRRMYPKITKEDITDFESRYIHSSEEIEDIAYFYNEHNGDMTKFFDYIPLSDPANTDGYIKIIDKLIAEKKIQSTDLYTKTCSEFKSIGKKYMKKTKKESKLFDKEASSDMDSLRLSIQSRQKTGVNFLDRLEAKYCSKDKPAKTDDTKKRGQSKQSGTSAKKKKCES